MAGVRQSKRREHDLSASSPAKTGLEYIFLSAQPNFAIIHQAPMGLAREIVLIQNLPAMNPQLAQQQNAQINQSLAQIIQINQILQNM